MLSGKPRRDFFFADARPRQAEAHVSRERRWGSDGACLEGVSAFSHDPIGYDGGINLYEYVGDDPLMRTDPTGTILRVLGDGPNGTPLPAASATDLTYFTTLLNKLCPQGGFTIDSSGKVSSSKPNFCDSHVGCVAGVLVWYGPDAWTPGTSTPVSCMCVCNAINSNRRFTLVYSTKRPNRTRGTGTNDVIITVGRPAKNGGATGTGDTSPPGPGLVRCPDWLILAHELCGHGLEDTGTVGGGHIAITVENDIRHEHSCGCDGDWGQRDGIDHTD